MSNILLFPSCMSVCPYSFTSRKAIEFQSWENSSLLLCGQNTRPYILQYCAGCLEDGDKWSCRSPALPSTRLKHASLRCQSAADVCTDTEKGPAGFSKRQLNKSQHFTRLCNHHALKRHFGPEAGFHLLVRHTQKAGPGSDRLRHIGKGLVQINLSTRRCALLQSHVWLWNTDRAHTVFQRSLSKIFKILLWWEYKTRIKDSWL